MEAKYIVGDIPGTFGSVLSAIVFPSFVDHKAIANKLDITDILGAGFVIYDSDNKPYCYGESTGLKIKSRGQEDSDMVRLLGAVS